MKSTKHHRSQKKQPKKLLHKYARFSGIAFQMIVIIVLGAFGGRKLDEAYPNENRLFTIIFTLLAVAVSMFYVIKQVIKTPNKP